MTIKFFDEEDEENIDISSAKEIEPYSSDVSDDFLPFISCITVHWNFDRVASVRIS